MTIKGFIVGFSECFTIVVYSSWMHMQSLLISGILFSACSSIRCCLLYKLSEGEKKEMLLCHKSNSGMYQEVFFLFIKLIGIKYVINKQVIVTYSKPTQWLTSRHSNTQPALLQL